jgi:hypothetical protein
MTNRSDGHAKRFSYVPLLWHTADPKLACVERQLARAGLRSRREGGRLDVEARYYRQAVAIMNAPTMHVDGRALAMADLPDDHPIFYNP